MRRTTFERSRYNAFRDLVEMVEKEGWNLSVTLRYMGTHRNGTIIIEEEPGHDDIYEKVLEAFVTKIYKYYK